MHPFRMPRTLLASCALASLLGSAEIQSPWVASDRTVDCTSHETIKRDLKLEAMKSDEERAIALYHFYRQRVFHYTNTPDSRDSIKNLNALGYTLCGSQGTCMKDLLASCAGIKARIRSMPGHTFYEAFYDGKWHGYDTFANFYVFTRGDKPNVASFEELTADKTLISDAAKEGRAVPGMCSCGDDMMGFATVNSEQNYQPLDLKYSPRAFRLRAGEEIVRSWWPDGRGVPSLVSSSKKYGVVPVHTCGGRSAKDNPALFKFWEPYAVPGLGGCARSFRHGTSGQINFSPDLTSATLAENGVTLAGPKPTAEGLSGAGDLLVPVTSPYYINSGILVFEASCVNEGDTATVSVGPAGKLAAVLTAKGKGHATYRVRFDDKLNGGILHAYQLKVTLAGGSVLHRMYLRTGFQWNAQSGPNLMPGRNQCTFTADNAEALKSTPVTIRYRYRQAPAWSEEVVVEKRAATSPFAYDITLPETGDKLPQMLDLTMTYGTLAWVPAGGTPDKVVCDLSKAEAVAAWKGSGAELTGTLDGNGMLLVAAAKVNQVQKRLEFEAPQDWSAYNAMIIEVENLGEAAQPLVFRASSDTTPEFKERTDVEVSAAPGKNQLRIPVTALSKTKVNAINKIYLMFLRVPDSGSKLRVTGIRLEGSKDL